MRRCRFERQLLTARSTTTGARDRSHDDRRHRGLAAEVGRPSHAPAVRIEAAWPRWPLFGRQAMLNAAAYFAPVSSISAGQQGSGQVADARDTVYGSEGQRCPSAGTSNRSADETIRDCSTPDDRPIQLRQPGQAQVKPAGRQMATKPTATGSIAANFHEAGRSEYLAQYIFTMFGTSVPVPR